MAVAAHGVKEDRDSEITSGQWIATMETVDDVKEAWTKVAPVGIWHI